MCQNCARTIGTIDAQGAMRVRALGLAILVVIALLAAPLAAEAQPAKAIRRIGFLDLTSAADVSSSSSRQGIVRGLADLGYVEGRTAVFVSRFA